ncbi:MAG: dTDP-4-dehydrorhamnose reductase [Elusimicrobiota bacterium]
MKYLITGANGQLAKEFLKILNSADVYAFDKSKLDISNEQDLKQAIDFVKPDIVLNCAAYNNVDGVETDYDRAYKVNAVSLKNMANFCERYKTFIIHFSTDYVFGGKDNFDPYKETDDTNPINKYGLTKLSGENFLKENYEKFLIFRVSWLYGDGKQNFIFKLINWAKNNKELNISVDEVSVPTPTKLVAELIIKSIKTGLKGIWHCIPCGFASRYEWAVETMKKLDPSIRINKAKQSDFKLPAKRPNFSAMDNSNLRKELNISIKKWDEYLLEYLSGVNI